MKTVRFELKKMWRQKKLLWLLCTVLICTAGLFQQNAAQQEKMAERALDKIDPYQAEVNRIQREFAASKEEQELDGIQARQMEHLDAMGRALLYWRIAIDRGEWDKIPSIEGDFLKSLREYEELGGVFPPLEGMERDIVEEKNAWMQKHGLPYEDETYPVSPHLMLKESTALLLNIVGFLILILLFGNTVTIEKEQRTWLMMKTQPISKWRLTASKYISLMAVIALFLLMTIGIGLAIPFAFTDYSLNLQYPQVIRNGNTFTIISTFSYLARAGVFFLGASFIIFSLVVLAGTRMKNSFSALMVMLFTLTLGYGITIMNETLQSVLNPFQLLAISNLLNEIPKSTDWLYPFAALIWSMLFLGLAIFLPEKNAGDQLSSSPKKPFRNGEPSKRPNALWNIVVFEWRKLQRKRLINQVCILLLLVLAIGYAVLSQQTAKKEAAYLGELQERVRLTKDAIAFSEETIAAYEKLKEETDNEFYGDAIHGVEKSIDYYLERESYIKTAIESYKKRDWMPFYEYQLYENRIVNEEVDTGGGYMNDLKSIIGTFTAEASIAEKQWLMKRNIQPVLSGEYISTIHHHWGNRLEGQKEWEEANRKVDNSGLFSLYLTLKSYAYFLPAILFLFLLGGGLAAERGKKATLNFLKTQPVADKNVFLGKLVHSILVAVLSCLGLFSMVVLAGTIFKRFGDWNYPILHYDSRSAANSPGYTGQQSGEFGFHFIPLGEHLLNHVFLFVLVLVFCIVFTIFLSVFLKHTLSVFATALMMLVVGYTASSRFLSDVAHLSPFTYLDIPRVTNGELATLLDNPGVNGTTGGMVLSSLTLLFIAAGYLLLGRRSQASASSIRQSAEKAMDH